MAGRRAAREAVTSQARLRLDRRPAAAAPITSIRASVRGFRAGCRGSAPAAPRQHRRPCAPKSELHHLAGHNRPDPPPRELVTRSRDGSDCRCRITNGDDLGVRTGPALDVKRRRTGIDQRTVPSVPRGRSVIAWPRRTTGTVSEHSRGAATSSRRPRGDATAKGSANTVASAANVLFLFRRLGEQQHRPVGRTPRAQGKAHLRADVCLGTDTRQMTSGTRRDRKRSHDRAMASRPRG